MKSWTSWLARVGLAGSSLIWAGCGGSDVPDPESDSHAVTAAAPTPVAPAPAVVAQPAQEEPPAPAPAPKPAAAEVAASAPAPAESAPAVEAAASSKSTDATATEEPANVKSEGPSATNEMLALASGPAPAASGTSATTPEGGSAAAANAGAAAADSAANQAMMESQRRAAAEAANNANSGNTGGSSGMPQEYSVSANDPGMDGAPSGPGGTLGPNNFRNPYTAAAAFLAALKARDADRLAQTTALRAPTEASVKYQKVFTAILEQSLAPEDLDELAKKFEGMTIINHNPPKSTGKYEIIVGKMQGTSQFHRTITLRKEKAGWKVCDISGSREFEKPIMIRIPGMRGGMGGGRR